MMHLLISRTGLAYNRRMYPPPASRLAFTLVELAIVLVIIGLIVGGVLAGQDLILTAERRKVITEWEGISASVNTFRGKYNGLPGDLPNASRYFSDHTAWNQSGNGNGLIANDSCGHTGIGTEVCSVWSHLSAAGLIGTSFPPCTNASGCNASFPKIGLNTRSNTMIAADSGGAQNYLWTQGIYNGSDSIWTTQSSAYHVQEAPFTPEDARWLDTKLDDGQARTGRFQLSVNWSVPVADNHACIDLTLPGEYAKNGGNATLQNYPRPCHIRYRASF